MEIKSVFDSAFKKYGKVIKGYDFQPLIDAMMKTECPAGVTYVPSVPELEAVKSVFDVMQDEVYGGLPIQIGYCNGNNYDLNALEYHRSSEVNIACGNDLILMLGKQEDIDDNNHYDTSKVELFLLPAGTAIEVYATSLHYAPCNACDGGFRCVVVLPKDTNTDITAKLSMEGECRLMTAKNKWLIAHKDSGLEADGAFIGLDGVNLSLKK